MEQFVVFVFLGIAFFSSGVLLKDMHNEVYGEDIRVSWILGKFLMLGLMGPVVLSMMTIYLVGLEPHPPLLVPDGDHSTKSIVWMVIDQAAKGALFDALEVHEKSFSSIKPNPEVFWFANIFVAFRIFVSALVIGAAWRVTTVGWQRLKKLFGFSTRKAT